MHCRVKHGRSGGRWRCRGCLSWQRRIVRGRKECRSWHGNGRGWDRGCSRRLGHLSLSRCVSGGCGARRHHRSPFVRATYSYDTEEYNQSCRKATQTSKVRWNSPRGIQCEFVKPPVYPAELFQGIFHSYYKPAVRLNRMKDADLINP